MAHREILTDVPEHKVDEIRQRFEQRGATVVVRPQGNGLFTIEATHSAAAIAETITVAAAPAAPVAANAPIVAALDGAPTSPDALTPTQAQTVKAIINLFETGRVLGHYGQVTLIPGDTGRLTYGRSQTTLGSGLLHELLQRYVDNAGARFAARLRPHLARIASKDESVDTDARLHNSLRAAADDPIMRETQDVFFDTEFWVPALRHARSLGVAQPLSVAIVYDGLVHGSWEPLRDATTADAGPVASIGERKWVAAYVARRRMWLAAHQREDLHPTVYRMDAFQRLIDQDRWGLALPIVVRDREISIATLQGAPDDCFEGPAPGTRALSLASPMSRGLDVRLTQLALSDAGLPIRADGIFGDASTRAIRDFQQRDGRLVTGVATPELVAELANRALTG